MSQFAGKSDDGSLNHADSEEPITGEVLHDSPAPEPEISAARTGTLAWLQAQPQVIILGHSLPACHRVPEGATWDDDSGTRCALVRADGSHCGATRTRLYGVCIIHAGGGADGKTIAALGGAAKSAVAVRAKLTRQAWGLQRNSPRSLARMMAAQRSEAVAEALLAPLDDAQLGSLERQRAAALILGETEPLAQLSAEVSLPIDADSVAAMDWASMRALAAQLLG